MKYGSYHSEPCLRPRFFLKGFKKADHACRVDACGREHFQAFPIRFLFILSVATEHGQIVSNFRPVGHCAGDVSGNGAEDQVGRRIRNDPLCGVAPGDTVDFMGRMPASIFGDRLFSGRPGTR